jgi:hypothetical protein
MAQRVLARYRTPMSTQQIMRLAFLDDLVPEHLHGHTQHKTLGARLSEDILRFRQRSRFFRTRPGRFFLRQFIKDKSLPIEYRTSIVARRRRRELKKSHLAYLRSLPPEQPSLFSSLPILSPEDFQQIVRSGDIGYADASDIALEDLCGIYSFVIITRGDEVLVHRKGNYREGRKAFVQKQTIGFTSPLAHDDMTLFDYDDHGLVSAGLTAVAIDLDVEFSSDLPRFEEVAYLHSCPLVPTRAAGKTLLGVVRVEAPTSFEPTRRRLAINDLRWMRISERRGSTADFDPWSRYLLRELPLHVQGSR